MGAFSLQRIHEQTDGCEHLLITRWYSQVQVSDIPAAGLTTASVWGDLLLIYRSTGRGLPSRGAPTKTQVF